MVPWGSLGRVGICKGAVGTGCCRACGRVPQPTSPANAFPAAAAATSQHRGLPKIACRSAGSSHAGGPHRPYGWDLAGGGTSIEFPAVSVSHSGSERPGTGAKPTVLVPKRLSGVHCAGAPLASGSSRAPTGGFFLPCEAQIYESRSQKQSALSH